MPGDTRPVPESVYVTAEPSAAIAGGFVTSDGWSIAFSRVVVGLGNVGFREDDASCNIYAEARYDRIFDFTVAAREKLGTVHALGTCRLTFRMRTPSNEVLLGPGVTREDVEFMRTNADDDFAADARASVLAYGSGTKGDRRVPFAWVFRQSFDVTHCERLPPEGRDATTLDLGQGRSSELRLEVRPEELFRADIDDAAPFVFQAVADAQATTGGLDVDGLGPLAFAEAPPRVVPDAEPWESLEALIYLGNLRRVVRVRGGGPCVTLSRPAGFGR